MSGKNFRVAQTGERTSVDGKEVRNKVLLAMPDNEYKLMRPDLIYIDLPSHLSLHESAQKIEFVYFPNDGNGFSSCSDQRRPDRGSGCRGQRGLRRCGIGSRFEQKPRARNNPDRRRWLPNEGECAGAHSAVGPAVTGDIEQTYRAARNASRADRGMQSAPRYTSSVFRGGC